MISPAPLRKPGPILDRKPVPVARRTGTPEPMIKPKVPAVLYARVSSRDQEKEGFSIPAQEKLLRTYAEDKGFVIQGEYVDIETAKKVGRTNFGKMLEWLRKNPSCKTILVEKTDRLYRNLKDWVELDGMDLDIHLVKEAIILSDGSRSHEKFIHGIKIPYAGRRNHPRANFSAGELRMSGKSRTSGLPSDRRGGQSGHPVRR